MVLAKANMNIASQYADLVGDEKLRKDVFARIVAEYEKTVAFVLEITGHEALLSHNPTLRSVIDNRLPYLDPLNHVQVEMMRRYRGKCKVDECKRIRHGVHTSINAIASLLRNSG